MPERGTYDLTYFAGHDGATMLIMKVDTFEELFGNWKSARKGIRCTCKQKEGESDMEEGRRLYHRNYANVLLMVHINIHSRPQRYTMHM